MGYEHLWDSQNVVLTLCGIIPRTRVPFENTKIANNMTILALDQRLPENPTGNGRQVRGAPLHPLHHFAKPVVKRCSLVARGHGVGDRARNFAIVSQIP